MMAQQHSLSILVIVDPFEAINLVTQIIKRLPELFVIRYLGFTHRLHGFPWVCDCYSCHFYIRRTLGSMARTAALLLLRYILRRLLADLHCLVIRSLRMRMA